MRLNHEKLAGTLLQARIKKSCLEEGLKVSLAPEEIEIWTKLMKKLSKKKATDTAGVFLGM